MIATYPISSLPSEIVKFWADAIQENGTLTPFHSYPWLLAWARAYGELEGAVAVTSVSAGGHPHALIPMMRRTQEFRSLSDNATDYTGLIWLNCDQEHIDDIAGHLRDVADATRVVLWNVRESDPLVASLAMEGALVQKSQTRILRAKIAGRTYQPGSDTSTLTRDELTAKSRRLSQRGAEIRFADSIGDGVLQEAMRIHTQRWRLRGGKGNFADSRRVDFVKEIAANRDVPVLLATMRIDSELIAYRWGPHDDRAYYDWNTGFANAFRRLSPGAVLLEELFKYLASGTLEFMDFLRGAEPYKLAWSSEESHVSEFTVLPRGQVQ